MTHSIKSQFSSSNDLKTWLCGSRRSVLYKIEKKNFVIRFHTRKLNGDLER